MRVLHLFDNDWPDLGFGVLNALIESAGRSAVTGVALGAVSGRVPPPYNAAWPQASRLGFPANNPLAAVPWLRRLRRRTHCDMIHAWGMWPAIITALSGLPSVPLLATVAGPLSGHRQQRWLRRAVGRRSITVVCFSQFIRDGLERQGVPRPDLCVIRPGMDVQPPSADLRLQQRGRLGLTPGQPVLVTCPPPSRTGGHYYAVWATALLEQIFPDIRLMIPGASAEQRRLSRFVRSFAKPYLYVFPDSSIRFNELLAAADVGIVPALTAVSTVALAGMMHAGLPIAASATECPAEFLQDGRTARLCPPRNATQLASAIRDLLRDQTAASRQAEAARETAGRLFDLSQMIKQYHRLYERLLRGQTVPA